ncbi:MAG: UDP-N-acetylenolpyruvoylglucosamine reductase [Desulfococcus sp.]|nr:MAG: UDP-N-acetylenolpyruvoylglucosamine reductase [Desulfococcus sp.]
MIMPSAGKPGGGFRERLRTLLGVRAEADTPLSRHTSFRVGGPAEMLCRVESCDELQGILRICREEKRPVHILGGGTNLLAADTGVRGAVIRLGKAFAFLSDPPDSGPENGPEDGTERAADAPASVLLRAGAAIPMRVLTGRCACRGLAGLNIMAGIPGTLGGAVVMNAGTRTGCISERIRSVEFMDGAGEIHEIDRPELVFRRRETLWPEWISRGPVIVLSVTLELMPGDPGGLIRSLRESLRARNRSQPVKFPSAGCYFRNPDTGPPAGLMIDRCGFRGMAVGGAAVSGVHANFIVNTGGATAADILSLAGIVRKGVARRFGVWLQEEVHHVS